MQDMVIRKATTRDLADIRSWLELEYQEAGEGFFCNWNVIEAIHDKDMLHALILGSEAVAFVADARKGPDIVAVRPDLRGKGLGRLAAEHALHSAYDRGNSVVHIECAPSTSIPFWQTMGFTMLAGPDGNRRNTRAYKTLPRKLVTPKGQPLPYSIKLYPEQRDWNKSTEPLAEITGVGSKVDNILHLPERAILYHPQIEANFDSVIGVQVSGQEVFEGKVKRPAAELLGVEMDPCHEYYMDTITCLDEVVRGADDPPSVELPARPRY
ncbi:GNAT family N-acetyltransferase [Sinorhizobium meliloti]|uniref:GNAT family N-acetyltransferase n=1 Tax=Rhizobium meliloti TaxID=382 RepID=UPI002380406D|nr:GNAT family N-acetyltransferase [Sinorhizobium meliloti]MDE3783411.1 GNAT family N-acetyltransferase [Sinorhizobium meliloti]MDE4593045.1 GNAT family N-acetyltransferase [Sinorhizobium meliloti]